MTYRSDQDAALARADALQVDLDRSRTELERAKALLAKREAELAAERERTAPSVAPATVAPPRSGNPVIALGIAGACFAAIVGVVTCAKANQAREREEQDKAFRTYLSHADLGEGMFRACTVRTIPSGAQVVSVGGAAPYPMGETPFTRTIGSWAVAGEHLEARLEGYEPAMLDQPATDYTTGTCETTITLTPISAR